MADKAAKDTPYLRRSARLRKRSPVTIPEENVAPAPPKSPGPNPKRVRFDDEPEQKPKEISKSSTLPSGASKERREARSAISRREVFCVGTFTIGNPETARERVPGRPAAERADAAAEYDPHAPGAGLAEAERAHRVARACEYVPRSSSDQFAEFERVRQAVHERLAAEPLLLGAEYDPEDSAAGMAEAEWRYRAFGEFQLYVVRPETERPNPKRFQDPF